MLSRFVWGIAVVVLATNAASVARAQQPQIGPVVRVDPGTSDFRWALEYSCVAHEHAVAMIWMRLPQEQSPFRRRAFGRAFSTDCGTTWTADILHGSDGTEQDPQSAVDERTGNFWVGGRAPSWVGSVFLTNWQRRS